MPNRRNPVVRHGALLRKGGAHTKTVSGQRHQSKRQLDDEIDDYFDEIESHTKGTEKGRIKSAPSSFYLHDYSFLQARETTLHYCSDHRECSQANFL